MSERISNNNSDARIQVEPREYGLKVVSTLVNSLTHSRHSGASQAVVYASAGDNTALPSPTPLPELAVERMLLKGPMWDECAVVFAGEPVKYSVFRNNEEGTRGLLFVETPTHQVERVPVRAMRYAVDPLGKPLFMFEVFGPLAWALRPATAPATWPAPSIDE